MSKGELNVQFVRPDKLLYEGPVASLVLMARSGELGIWPGHASEICALGDGVVRLNRREVDGGGTVCVIVAGGYAEVDDDNVIILADHARRSDDIEPEVVRETLLAAQEARDALDEGDHRRAYYENKMAWCNLLLSHADDEA